MGTVPMKRCVRAFWLLSAAVSISAGGGCASNQKIAARLQATKTSATRTQGVPTSITEHSATGVRAEQPVPDSGPMVVPPSPGAPALPIPGVAAPAAEDAPMALLLPPPSMPLDPALQNLSSALPLELDEPQLLAPTPTPTPTPALAASFVAGDWAKTHGPGTTHATSRGIVILPPAELGNEVRTGLAPAPASEDADDYSVVLTEPAPLRNILSQSVAEARPSHNTVPVMAESVLTQSSRVDQVVHSRGATSADPLLDRLDQEFARLRKERDTLREAVSTNASENGLNADQSVTRTTNSPAAADGVTGNPLLLNDVAALVSKMANERLAQPAGDSTGPVDRTTASHNPEPGQPPGTNSSNPLTNPANLISVGRMLFEKKLYRDAEAAFRGAVQLAETSEDHTLATYLLATSLRKQERRGEAASYYEQVARLDDDRQLTQMARWQLKNLSARSRRL
jgi:TolA-binding protein